MLKLQGASRFTPETAHDDLHITITAAYVSRRYPFSQDLPATPAG